MDAMETNILKEFRERHGLTQSDLGIALGIEPEKAQSRISHYETTRRELPKDFAYRFIDFAREHGDLYALEDIYPRDLVGAA